MHGFRILQRRCMPCGQESPPVAYDDETGLPLRFMCTEPVHHTTDHVARLDDEVLMRWSLIPSPAV